MVNPNPIIGILKKTQYKHKRQRAEVHVMTKIKVMQFQAKERQGLLEPPTARRSQEGIFTSCLREDEPSNTLILVSLQNYKRTFLLFWE